MSSSTDGLLQGAVFVIGPDDRVLHAEYVADRMAEPDDDAVLRGTASAA